MTRFRKAIAVFAAILLSSTVFSCESNNNISDDVNTDIPSVSDENDGTETEQDESLQEVNDPENIDSETDGIINSETEEKEDIPDVPEIVNPFEGETLESFYGNAAFVGDSVMHGLQLYSARGITATTNSTFLTLSSFAARHALSEVTDKSYHPLYEGVKMKTEDALALAGVDKVFVSLGLNDVRVTPKTYYENYIEFLGKIKEKCPDIKIFIVSTTYPVEVPNSNKMDKATALDYRNQLYDLNTRLYGWCKENGGYFVDVMSPLISDSGFLANEYTSDNYVHLTNKAYTIWEQTLIDYATSLIEAGIAPDSFPAIPVYVQDEVTPDPDEALPSPDETTIPDTPADTEAGNTFLYTSEVTNEN